MKFRALFKRKKEISSKNPKLLPFLNESLGIQPIQIELYEEAFTHKSTAVRDEEGIKRSYERLEFLGDAIIGAIVSEYVYQYYPDEDEGYLTKLKSKVVSRQNLNRLAQKLNLEPIISYKRKNSRHKSLLGNVFEALFGAIYLDLGYTKTKEVFIQRIITPYIDLEKLSKEEIDFKSKLLNYCQVNKIELKYDLISEEVRGGYTNFTMGVYLDDELIEFSSASSKREAEQKAAKKTLQSLDSE